jgi:arginase family enzyme
LRLEEGIDAGEGRRPAADECRDPAVGDGRRGLEAELESIRLACRSRRSNDGSPGDCGDDSISYPNIRGIAPLIDGDHGIIHFDRHIDIKERDMDERMHTTHFFHATNILNVRPATHVQIAIGGWFGSRPGLKVARERETTVISVGDIEAIGIERTTEIALEVAWRGTAAVFLSFNIDFLDIGFTP